MGGKKTGFVGKSTQIVFTRLPDCLKEKSREDAERLGVGLGHYTAVAVARLIKAGITIEEFYEDDMAIRIALAKESK